jgi:hypothetical protein
LRNEPFIETVGRLLREDLEVSNDYFKANASNRLCDIVKQYEIVSRMFGKWAGKRPPGFCQPIEPVSCVFELCYNFHTQLSSRYILPGRWRSLIPRNSSAIVKKRWLF